MKIISFIAVAGLMAAGAVRGEAQPVTWDGSLELRGPVFSQATASATSDWRNLEMAGDVRVRNLLGPFVIRVQGEHTFHQSDIFSPENKLKAGLEWPLSHDLTVFSYWDRRFDPGIDRVFVGVRLGFSGSAD